MKDVAASLYSLIEPACPVLFFIKWHCESLPTAVVNGIDQRYIELVGMLGQVVGCRHACIQHHISLWSKHRAHQELNGPAAPAPTTRTLFRPLADDLLVCAICSLTEHAQLRFPRFQRFTRLEGFGSMTKGKDVGKCRPMWAHCCIQC
jgi:hypothetical protein